MESASYVLSFRMVFFYLVTTGWIFFNLLRPTLMGTKNVYENGPNPFFLIRDQKFGQADSYRNEKFIRKWTKSTGLGAFYSLSLSMRRRYNNEIAEWK